jgi:hypothetical protein
MLGLWIKERPLSVVETVIVPVIDFEAALEL